MRTINGGKYDEFLDGFMGDEYAKVKEQDSYGFLSEEEDNIFRDAVMQELMRIIYLNHNYDNEVENLNELIENAGNE